MGQDNDWVLRAPYGDKTFMRDALVFELMQGTFEFTPTEKYCELVLNGIYQEFTPCPIGYVKAA